MRVVMRTEPDAGISKMLSARVEAGDFPSAVYLFGRGGEPGYAGALGDAVREPERRAARLETIYDLASLTKPLVTALLCALLCERGRIDPDAPASLYVSEFARGDKSSITVRQLLTHTSGLPAWRPLHILTQGEPGRVLQVIADLPLEHEPGLRVLYSDLGFITLGLILERVAGREMSDLARFEITEPLKLERTFFNPAQTFQIGTAACESAGNAYERGMCSEAHGLPEPRGFREHLIWGEVHDGNAHFLGGAAGHAGLFSTALETHALARQFLPSNHTAALA
jgi:CubicO group peptidase (beta-lactamase class C family)